MSSRPVVVVFSENAGMVSAIRTAPAATAERTGRRRTRSRMAPQKRLSPFLLRSRRRNGIRPFSTLSPSLPSSAGQHGERAEHRDRDDHHRPDREGHERLVAGEEHAGHRDQHGDARDEDGAAGGGCGGLEGGVLAASGGPLLTLAAEVEERVVDSDGEADQEDHLGDLLVDGDELARERDQGRRRDDGGDRQQHRDQGRDGGAEDEQQDDERQRERDHAGGLEHAVERLVDCLAGAGAAELLDVEARDARQRSCRRRRRSCRCRRSPRRSRPWG